MKPSKRVSRPEPANFVERVNGHGIYRNESGLCDVYTRGTGWWAFNLTIDDARTTCMAVGGGGEKE